MTSTCKTLSALLLLTLLAFLHSELQAQEQSGVVNSNFAGSAGFSFNPASSANMALNWDVQLFEVAAYLHTDYGYLADQSILRLLQNPDQSLDDQIVYSDKISFDALIDGHVRGPGFAIRAGNHAFGFFSAVRLGLSANNIDRELGYDAYSEIPFGQPTEVRPLQLSAMLWSEYGLNYSTNIYRTSRLTVSAGLNLKYLRGLETFNLSSSETATFNKFPDAINSFEDLDVELAYSEGVSSQVDAQSIFQPAGHGAGVDLGVEIKLLDNIPASRESNNNDFQYSWKFGFSIVDLGAISFRNGSGSYQYEEIEPALIAESQLEEIESASDFQSLLSQAVYQGDVNGGFVSNNFNVQLPSALIISMDRNLGKDFYLSANIVRNLPARGRRLKRENIISINPRYERKFFEMGIPMLLADDSELRFGAFIRLGWFYLGTDDLGSWIIPGKLNGSDIYAGLKINDFGLASNNKNRRKRSGRKLLECPALD